MLACLLTTAAIVAQDSREDRLKAAVLLDFLRFVQWTPQAMPAAGEPLSLCVVGRDGFTDALRRYTAGRLLQGHPFYVHPVTDLRATASCRVVFVTNSNRSQWPAIFAAARGHDALTVSFCPDFAQSGGVINLVFRNGSPHFQINLQAAAQQNVIISSRLIPLAEIVGN